MLGRRQNFVDFHTHTQPFLLSLENTPRYGLGTTAGGLGNPNRDKTENGLEEPRLWRLVGEEFWVSFGGGMGEVYFELRKRINGRVFWFFECSNTPFFHLLT